MKETKMTYVEHCGEVHSIWLKTPIITTSETVITSERATGRVYAIQYPSGRRIVLPPEDRKPLRELRSYFPDYEDEVFEQIVNRMDEEWIEEVLSLPEGDSLTTALKLNV